MKKRCSDCGQKPGVFRLNARLICTDCKDEYFGFNRFGGRKDLWPLETEQTKFFAAP
jgi:hypothetical protein